MSTDRDTIHHAADAIEAVADALRSAPGPVADALERWAATGAAIGSGAFAFSPPLASTTLIGDAALYSEAHPFLIVIVHRNRGHEWRGALWLDGGEDDARSAAERAVEESAMDWDEARAWMYDLFAAPDPSAWQEVAA